jgi:hypothetical protein
MKREPPWPRIAHPLSGEFPMEYDARNPPPLVLGNRRGPRQPTHVPRGDEWIAYILLLEGDRFYVGATVDMLSRWFLHLDGWHVGTDERGRESIPCENNDSRSLFSSRGRLGGLM